MRILIVEDEKRLAGTLQDLLRRQGYTADVCYDGISGLDNARSDIYDLLVLDAMLPGMDGFALLRQLRGGGSRLPVLMLTARSELNDRVRGLDAGADYYLTKPFEPEELLACIRSLLRRGGEDAAAELKRWLWWASHSRIPAMHDLYAKVKRHKEHILNTIRLGLSNPRIEAANNKIKLIIRKAFGFRNIDNLLDMVYLVCSDLTIPLPNRSSKPRSPLG